ncbi:hypothetical protein KCU65_g206, partial [Aureobasidium melanogenum]
MGSFAEDAGRPLADQSRQVGKTALRRARRTRRSGDDVGCSYSRCRPDSDNAAAGVKVRSCCRLQDRGGYVTLLSAKSEGCLLDKEMVS